MLAAKRLLRQAEFRKPPSLLLRFISNNTRKVVNQVKPSKVKYEYVDPDEVERLDYYVPGGYHPVQIGDKLHDGRYVIVHKLGFGRSATAWLAESKQNNQLVALKISTAESAERTIHESKVLTRLGQAKSQLPGKAIVQTLLDSFSFSGPNGIHQCLVVDAARINIDEAKEAAYHRLLHLPPSRAIAVQLILGVQFVHSQGIVHGGMSFTLLLSWKLRNLYDGYIDLHLGNVLLRLPPSLQHMTIEQLYAKIGKPAKEPVVRCNGAPLDPGVPSELIIPLWLGLGSDEITLNDAPILLTDFGEAFDPSIAKTFTCYTPHLLAPPEAFFGEPATDECLSFGADIWTLACTIWEILGSSPPFEVFVPSLDSVTREHVEAFGKLPDRWWRKWANRNNWFDEDGRKNVTEHLKQCYSNSARGWDQRFPGSIQGARRRASNTEHNFEVFGEDEGKAFGDMIKSMLVLEPGQRATIEDVVNCEWMQRWGLPELHRMEEKVREEETRFLYGNS